MSKKSQEVFDAARQREKEIVDGASTAAATDEFLQGLPLKKERPKGMEVVSTGASYHDFNKQPVFEGSFLSKFLAPKDMKGLDGRVQPKGSVIGYNFVQDGTDKVVIISNSHAITEALEKDAFSESTAWWIEFEGKVERKGKKPFNQFYIAKKQK